MRILFSFAGGNGHFQPLVPLAQAATQAGHTIAVAGQPVMIPVIEAAGFTAIAIAGETLSALPKRQPLLKIDLAREDRDLRQGFATRLARQHASELIPLCESWRPDLLVCDEVDFGALIAAERLQIPYATVLVIASGAFIRKEVIAEPLSLLRGEYGLPPDPNLTMLNRYLVLSPFPPGFRHPGYPLPATAHAFRPPAINHNVLANPEWAKARDVPVVYFTLGTIFNVESGDLFERVLMALSDLPVQAVVTVGREIDPDGLGPQAANIHIERYIPQELVLPNCDLAITHAGSGSVIGALAHGLPMVLLPIGADQPYNAMRCQDLGVARVLDAVEATPATIRSAITDVLSAPRFRKNVEPLRREIAALPGIDTALRLLERLVVEKRPLLSI